MIGQQITYENLINRNAGWDRDCGSSSSVSFCKFKL